MAAQKGKENTATTNGSVLDDNKVLIYVASKQFPPKQCLEVTEENMFSLARLTAQEDFAAPEERLKEIQNQNALVMRAFREIRINSGDDRFVAVFVGCNVMVCLCSRNELAKPMGSAIKNILYVEDSNKTLRVPWMEHNLTQKSTICTFNTGHLSIDDKFSTVTFRGQTLRELIQVSTQDLLDKLSKVAAVMYGPVEESGGGGMTVG